MSDSTRKRTAVSSSDTKAVAASTHTSTSEASSVTTQKITTSTFLLDTVSPCWSLVFLFSLVTLIPIRLYSAWVTPIQECYETFNYWEPLHFLLEGRGLQTWEYSPAYGLRSYLYLWLVSTPALLVKFYNDIIVDIVFKSVLSSTIDKDLLENLNLVLPPLPKYAMWYGIRFSFALLYAVLEAKLIATIQWRLKSSRFAFFLLIFLAVSPGTFHSSSAFLPQTFTTFFVMLTLCAWMRGSYGWGIFWVGVTCLIGWPFSFLLAFPLALEILYVYAPWRLYKPVMWGVISLLICVVPSLLVDYYYYHKWLWAILNIAIYNSNQGAGEKGANLYGVEPASYWVYNLLLNFNIVAVLMTVAPVFALFGMLFSKSVKAASSTSLHPVSSGYTTVFYYLSPLYIWMAAMFMMPHKEERFLFVIYPYICVAAAFALHVITKILQGSFTDAWVVLSVTTIKKNSESSYAFNNKASRNSSNTAEASALANSSSSSASSSSPSFIRRLFSWLLLIPLFILFLLISVSRIGALLHHYSAPLSIYHELHDVAINQEDLHPATFPVTLASTGFEKRFGGPNQTMDFNVCIGKEWYRFHTHFFLPTIDLNAKLAKAIFTATEAKLKKVHYRLTFLPSSFGGLLPKPYLESTDGRGTWVTPTGMNDLNSKEEEGRFVESLDQCHYIIDFELPSDRQVEPRYSTTQHLYEEEADYVKAHGQCVQGWKWVSIFQKPFLDSATSPSLSRAFYVPQEYAAWLSKNVHPVFERLSDKHNKYLSYHLLRRIQIDCDPAKWEEETQQMYGDIPDEKATREEIGKSAVRTYLAKQEQKKKDEARAHLKKMKKQSPN